MTNYVDCATVVKHKQQVKHTFLFKYSWRGTAKLVRIIAKDEEEAIVKANKSKEAGKGEEHCLEVIMVKQIN